jgi:hypothetical protein
MTIKKIIINAWAQKKITKKKFINKFAQMDHGVSM